MERLTGSEMNKLTVATMQVEALRKQVNDAQATIAALQARVRTATQLIIAEIGASGPEDLEEAIGRIVGQLTQRTAELERRTGECNEISKMYVEAHAELERVRGELATYKETKHDAI